ncbi:MAG: choice-of-anchor J domain-containing protein [Patulibacter sp.]
MPSPDAVSTTPQPRRRWRSARRAVVAGVVALACLPAAHSGAASLSENFDDPGVPGWLVKNNSTSPSGTFGWGSGNPTVFPAYNGAPSSYVSVNYQTTTAVSGATISNWLMTPRMFGLSQGDKISFYTRKPGAAYPDRLEVRMSTNGSCNPGTSEADIGDFETLLVSVNPTLVAGGYPTVWTRYEVTLPSMTPARGCVAFRYYVTNAGSSAPNSDYIGLDQVDVVDRDGDITPDTTIATGPSGAVGPDAAAFTYTGTPSDGVASYECRLISADEPDPELASCPTAGREYEELAAGEYTFEVRAVSVDGNVDPTPATREFTVDTTAPDTSIASGPEGLVGSADATFTYDGDPSEDVAGFDCRLTPEGTTPTTFATCPSAGRDYTGLNDGTYLFEVRAKDAVGNADPSPATREFTVDTTAPDTSISSGPEGLVGSADASFAFAGSPVGDVEGLECRLRSVGDDDPAFVACDAPTAQAYDDLADGKYTFEVRAKDAAGNADPSPATREFTVDTTAPDTEIVSGPEGLGADADVAFGYASVVEESGVTFECRLVGPSAADPEFTSCAVSGESYEVPDGAYRFEVRAVDAAGNADPSPATREFTVDATAPDTSISSGPEGLVGSADASFVFAGTPAEDVEGLECRLRSVVDDDPAFVACDGPTAQAYDDLADGTYTFEVRAKDAAGNADPSPATRNFTVDTTAPTVTITTGPEPTSATTTAVFAYASSPVEDVEAVECRLIRPDDADPAFAPCADDAATYEGLAVGAYRFELRARDAIGNVSAIADWSFTVETPPLEEPPAEQPPGETPTTPTTPTPTTPSAPPVPFVPPARRPELPIAPPGPPANPQVSGLRLERTTFRAARTGAAFGPAGASLPAGRGTWLRFGLDRAVRIELRISRSVKRRWRPLRGVVATKATRGTVRIAVRGRFRGVTLRPGRYRLSVTLTDPATGAKTTELRQFRIRR